MKAKLLSIKSLKKLLDRLWSKRIHEIWNEECAVCGSHEKLQAHHFRSRRFTNTRWNLDNGILLCAGCHFNKAHRDYEWMRREFEDIHGPEMIEHLWEESQKIVKVNREYLEKQRKILEKEGL